MRHISEVVPVLLLIVIFITSFSSITLFWISISICYFLIYWNGLMVCFLKVLYSAAQRTILLHEFWIPLSQSTTIGPYVIIYCTFVGEMVCCDILLLSSALSPEETWMEATHVCMLVGKLVVLMGVRFVYTNMSLMVFRKRP